MKPKYYKIKTASGVDYIAARTKGHVISFVERQEHPKGSGVFFGGYDLDTLEQITEQKARRTPYFEDFVNFSYELTRDGTWHLGTIKEKE